MGDVDGQAIVRLVKEHGDMLVMVISGSSDVKKAVEALREGVPLHPQASHQGGITRGRQQVGRRGPPAANHPRAARQLDERFGFEGLIGNSPRMRGTIEKVKAFAPTKATVLILGENGTGKELVAKALHE